MKLLTIDDIAALLNCRKSFIYSLSAQGRIPGRLKLGHRQLRFREDLILEWIERETRNGGDTNEKATGK